jgi:hypothetical protein
MRTIRFAVLLAVLLPAACAGPAPRLRPMSEQERLQSEHDQYMQVQRRLQREMAWQNTGPRHYEFPGHGTVVVRSWELCGLPGQEYLLLWYTYDNTTSEELQQARVTVTVRDPEGRPVGQQWADITMPYFPFWPGNTYTDELRIPVHGVHRQQGWSWAVDCFARLRAEPSALLWFADAEPLRSKPQRQRDGAHLFCR